MRRVGVRKGWRLACGGVAEDSTVSSFREHDSLTLPSQVTVASRKPQRYAIMRRLIDEKVSTRPERLRLHTLAAGHTGKGTRGTGHARIISSMRRCIQADLDVHDHHARTLLVNAIMHNDYKLYQVRTHGGDRTWLHVCMLFVPGH